jgi:hypothetical protein
MFGGGMAKSRWKLQLIYHNEILEQGVWEQSNIRTFWIFVVRGTIFYTVKKNFYFLINSDTVIFS